MTAVNDFNYDQTEYWTNEVKTKIFPNIHVHYNKVYVLKLFWVGFSGARGLIAYKLK